MKTLALLITSFAEEKDAKAAIRTLVQEHLVVCGTIIPKAHSIYFWEEKIEETEEVMVWLKTAQEEVTECMKRLESLHPYKVPEIIIFESNKVSPAYAQWIDEVLNRNISR